MKSFVVLSVVSLAALYPTVGFAQEAPPPAQGSDGDIVVTATRETTLLSKTPITMSALNSESLRNGGITDARTLQNAVPNLAFSPSGAGDSVRISIRGVTSTDTTEKGDPSAAFLLDGIYIARPADTLGSFYDLDRVEVLRGPQGTLYGRNTTAGVINVIAKRPTDHFEASVDGSYGNLGRADATAMVNVGLGTSLGVRAAVNYQREDPFYTVPAGAKSQSPFRETISGRLSLGGTVGDNLSFVIRGDASKTTGSGVTGNFVTLNRFYTNTGVPTVDPTYVQHDANYQRMLTVAPAFPNSRDNRNYGIGGEATYDFGPVQLTYLGSWRKTDRVDTRDLVLFGGLNNPAAFNGKFEQNSQELRLAFGKGRALHGQIGAYYFHEKSNLEYDVFAPLSALVVPGATNYAFPQGPVKATSKAVFSTVTYDLTSALHITGGIRYTDDLKSRNGATIVDFASVSTIPAGFSCASQTTLSGNSVRCTLNQNIARKTWAKTTWKAGLDYDVRGLGLAYASVSTGYKAGGFNDGCVAGSGIGCALTPAALYYDPETLTAYEAGIKFRISSAFRFNAAAFHYDYNNLQVSQIVSVPIPATLIRNAAKAKVDGVEMEATLAPSRNDKVDLGFTYTNARYKSFTPDPVNHPTYSFNGKELDHAPKYTATAGYVHTFQIGNGATIDLGMRTRLSAAYYMIDLSNLSQFRQPSFTKTDVTATFTASHDRFYIQAFARNLENTITIATASTGITSGVYIEEPRTYGVRGGFKF